MQRFFFTYDFSPVDDTDLGVSSIGVDK